MPENTTAPTPAMLAGTRKPIPEPELKPRPVKRRNRGPRIASHVDPSTVAKLRKLGKEAGR